MENLQTEALSKAHPAKPKPPIHRVQYDGKPGKIFTLLLRNLALGLLTLGIHRFWGITNLRRYIANSFSLLGDRFEYTGTGKELFLGFIKVSPVIIALYSIYSFIDIKIVKIITGLVFFYLILAGSYFSLQYKLSRTVWRGIRGRLQGSAWHYGGIAILWSAASLCTLGLLRPYADMKLINYQINNMAIGRSKLRFKGEAKAIYGYFFKCWILLLPTLFISSIWYHAKLSNYILKNTGVKNIRFAGRFKGGPLFRLYIGNFFIFVFTLSLGRAWIIDRIIRFNLSNAVLLGDLENSAAFQQSSEKLGKTGEGLAGAFGDIGIL